MMVDIFLQDDSFVTQDEQFSKNLAKRIVYLTGYESSADVGLLIQMLVEINEACYQGSSAVCWDQLSISKNYLPETLLANFPQLIGTDPEKPLFYQFEKVGFLVNALREKKVANFIKEKQQAQVQFASMNDLFKNKIQKLDSWQAVSAVAIAHLPFCVITGGAGTGKTTTLMQGLELCFSEHQDYSVVVSAPTGKAVNRLKEALGDRLSLKQGQSLLLKTIHQLLGISQTRGLPYYKEDNLIDCDLLVIDESSMLNTEIFCAVLMALPSRARLVLLGDDQQLPAINAPSFFSSLCGLKEVFSLDFILAIQNIDASFSQMLRKSATDQLSNTVLRLKKSFRFAGQSQVGECADCILKGQTDSLINHLVISHSLFSLNTEYLNQLGEQIFSKNNSQDGELICQIKTSMVLCTKNTGKYSSAEVNAYLDQKMREYLSVDDDELWYLGRRIIYLQNDYARNIYNGDIGVCLLVNDQWVIDFGGVQIDVAYLQNNYKLAYAISIHKSQGSEYNHVLVVLDEDISPLISKTLLYTAVTRAKQSVKIFSNRDVLQFAVNNDRQTTHYLNHYLNDSSNA